MKILLMSFTLVLFWIFTTFIYSMLPDSFKTGNFNEWYTAVCALLTLFLGISFAGNVTVTRKARKNNAQ